MSRRNLLSSLLILYFSLIFNIALVRCQKLTEEEPLDSVGGSGFNPDDEDFDGESGLPPEGIADEHHHVHATTSKSSPVRTLSTTTSSVTFTRQKPNQATTLEVPSREKTSPFMSTYAMMAVVALAVLLVLIIIVVIGCCCRKSQRNEYTRGEARSKSYV